MRYLIFIFASMFFVGCANTNPEEVSSSQDNRGSIAFQANEDDDLDIYLDGNYIGQAEDFLVNENKLMILPGSHKLLVQDGKKIIYQEKIFIGNNVNKVIFLN